MRAKLQDGKLIYPPHVSARPDGSTVVGYGMREDILIADGWKTVEDVAQPDGLHTGSWLETAEAITRVWTPREKTDAEKAGDAEGAERQAARTAKLEGLRGAYRTATRALCREAGITEVDVLTADKMDAQLFPLLDDADTNAKSKRNVKLLAHTVKLLHLTMLLRSEDMPDALDRS